MSVNNMCNIYEEIKMLEIIYFVKQRKATHN